MWTATADRPAARRRHTSERGIALVVVMLMLLLVSALLVGFTTLLITEQRVQMIDRDRTRSFYAAHAGLEQLTADLGSLFTTTYAPTGEQVRALTETPPSIPGVEFVATGDGPGYDIAFVADAQGNPAAVSRTITAGPYQGFSGLVTPYTMRVTARTAGGGESRLERQMQTVSIPVFQFGLFSDTDMSFFAGPAFDFGGRVHTNGNLFLASGATLTLSEPATAVGEVIRTNLSNGWNTSTNYTGTVRIRTAPGAYRALARTEGSLVGTLGSAQNEPAWSHLSVGTYNGNIRNGRTGARPLNLPLITIGGTPIEMIRRPPPGESATAPLFAIRYFSMASLRILLSDAAAQVSALATVSGQAPVPLGDTVPAGYTVAPSTPPFALSQAETKAYPSNAQGADNSAHLTNPGSPLLGGVLKIERQTPAGHWVDVTAEILSLGIASRNPTYPTCTDPSPDAVIRLQRVRDDPSTGPSNRCGEGTVVAADFWPQALYDAREGDVRDSEAPSQTSVYLGGVMHYVTLDVRNLGRWFRGEIGTTGTDVMNETGYVVYFSDRRSNRSAANTETGEYGNEDVVNPETAAGTPNGTLDPGEDMNGNGAFDAYGRTAVAPEGMREPAVLGWTPSTMVDRRIAQANPALFFRRALKLVNGRASTMGLPGLTVVSENPVYVEGDYNADGSFNGTHAACAILADAVTLLSNNWNDDRSFQHPHNPAQRNSAETWYRVAIIAGKGPSFPRPTWAAQQDFGTDGGVHNFLRYLENWSGRRVWYLGSMASFYFHRQAVGTYKCCVNVYNPPTRQFQFDTDFLTPSLLPPRTPMFRDLNAIGFTQVVRAPQ